MSNAFDKASLVMLPHAYEEGKVYSLKPTDRSGDFTFSRGTDTATRVGEDGYIKKEYANLLEQSNTFSDAIWTTSGTLTPNQTGYDGSTDAWLYEKSAAFQQIGQTISQGGVSTFSVYLKAGSYEWVRLRISNLENAYYQLTGDGSLGTIAGGAISAKIDSVGNGWYRCSISVNSTISDVKIYPVLGDNDMGTSGSIYIQDAQLNQGLVAYPYLETTTAPVYGGLTDDMPRLDYSGGATCPSLLLEPSRTNLMKYSEYFGGWSAIGGTPTRTPNAATSPEGLTNAYSLSNTSGSTSRIRNENLVAISGDKFVISMFAKENAGSTFNIRHQTSPYILVRFDLSDQSYTGGGSWVDNVDFIEYGNGWYRCLIYVTAGATSAGTIEIELANNDSIYAYGFMAESGSYPTSYIPNHSGGSATRAADTTDRGANLSYTGNYTLFMEFKLTQDTVYLLNSNNSTAYSLFIENDDCYFFFGRTGGDSGFVQFVNKFNWSANLGTNIKMAFYKNGTSSKMFVNGTEYTPSSNTLSTGNEVLDWRYLNYSTTANRQEQAYIKQLLEFEEALSDEQCIALTTL